MMELLLLTTVVILMRNLLRICVATLPFDRVLPTKKYRQLVKLYRLSYIAIQTASRLNQ